MFYSDPTRRFVKLEWVNGIGKVHHYPLAKLLCMSEKGQRRLAWPLALLASLALRRARICVSTSNRLT